MVFYTHHNDIENSALFPFGYGLSYTDFTYSEMKLSADNMSVNDMVEASVIITNSGEVDGEEIVQLYIQDLVASLTRPIKELKGFEKLKISAGESETVSFQISAKDLSFYKKDNSYGTEPGKFKIFIGSNSTIDKYKEITLL